MGGWLELRVEVRVMSIVVKSWSKVIDCWSCCWCGDVADNLVGVS